MIWIILLIIIIFIGFAMYGAAIQEREQKDANLRRQYNNLNPLQKMVYKQKMDEFEKTKKNVK